MVDALYIDPRGPYPALLGAVHCWDESRSAYTYDGAGPIVAHPPCAAWSWLKRNFKGDADKSKRCGRHAVDLVQRLGGVLEQPESSGLWEVCGLPYPDDGFGPDEFGGFAIDVLQVDWGHKCRKHTWLYIVCQQSRNPEALMRQVTYERNARAGTGTVTHWIGGSRKNPLGSIPPGIKAASAEIRVRTPEPFAHWLISIAERCK